ncbi:MAG: Rpn family recombination-promoting nuclease/putative transposase [Pirellulaceae bacterium]
MLPGIDPKVDVAFKRIFGSEPWRHLTVSLINAVLSPVRWGPMVDLELLNPFTQQIALDDKLSILDIKARDDQGRVFNVEMQMVARAALPQRFLYYWSRMYAEQLVQGDTYKRLCPTISICFVNGRLFPDRLSHHRRFRLLDADSSLCLTDQLEIHVLELPNFQCELADLREPLDFWLYFLKNGEELDADALPEPLNREEVRRAMEVLKMVSQDALEREIYEGRMKAKRDALSQELEFREALEKLAEAQQRAAVAEQRCAESEQQRIESEQRLAAAAGERDAFRQTAKSLLIRQIQLYERLLGHDVTDSADLQQQDDETLRATADRCERELTRPSEEEEEDGRSN